MPGITVCILHVNAILTTTYDVGATVFPVLQMRKQRQNQEQKNRALDPRHTAAEPAFVITALSLTAVPYGEFGGGRDSPEHPIPQTRASRQALQLGRASSSEELQLQETAYSGLGSVDPLPFRFRAQLGSSPTPPTSPPESRASGPNLI